MMQGLVLRPLLAEDAEQLSSMLQAQPAAYMRYFIPFHFDIETIAPMLERVQRDAYMGIFWGGQLAGFFMLRGWDSGYEIPAYGVTIDIEHRNMGLGRLSLETSKTIARLEGATQVMLKVHPDNTPARKVYEAAGFVQTGVDPKNANLIYHYSL